MRHHLLLAGLIAAAGTVHADTIVTMTLDAKVYTVDTATGVPTLVSDYSFSAVRGMAYHHSRNTFFFVDSNRLYEFPLGGQPTFRRTLEFVGPTGTMWDIAIDRSGVVWGTESVSDGPDNLWRFGFASGSTLIGDTLLNGNLDFGADGSLYLWHSDGNPAFDGLFVVSKHTARPVKIAPEGDAPNLSAFCTLDTFTGAYGQAFNGQLFFVRLDTGSTALVGGPNMDFRGAAHGVVKKFPATVTLGAVNLGRIGWNEEGCLEDRDNLPLRVCKFIVPNTSVPPVRYELNINAPNNPSIMDTIARARMTVAGGFVMRTQAKRISNGQFDTLASLNLSTTYAIQTRRELDATPYLDSSGAGVFRIEVQQSGPSASPNFCFDLDQFAVAVE